MFRRIIPLTLAAALLALAPARPADDSTRGPACTRALLVFSTART